MTGKAAASLSGTLLQRGTRERRGGFVLAPVEAPAEQWAAARPHPGDTPPVATAGPAAGLPTPSDGSLEALSRRIGPLLGEYLTSRPLAVARGRVLPEAAPEPGPQTLSEAAEPTAAVATHADGDSPVAGLPVLPEEQCTGRVAQLVEAYRHGDRMLGEEIFAELTGLAPEEVSRLLYHAKSEVVAGACRALGMDQLHFVSLFVMTRRATLLRHSVDPRELGRVVEFFNGLSREAAGGILAAWRRNAWG